MTITQVQYVLEVAKSGNISCAAKRLFISQSALSQQIRRLEYELGFPLFVRTAHMLKLTEDGTLFCREARPVIDSWIEFSSRSLARRPHKRTSLRVVIGARAYSNGLFSDIVRFFDIHSEIEASFVTEAGKDYLTSLKEGTIDLALDRLPSEDYLDKQAEFYSQILISEQQCVLMSPNDPKADHSILSFQDLQGCTMISGLENSAEEKILKNTCKKYGIALNRVYRSDSIETNMNLVRNGIGIVIGPPSFAKYYQLTAVKLAPAAEVSLRFICLKKSLRRKEISLFMQHLLTACASCGLTDV